MAILDSFRVNGTDYGLKDSNAVRFNETQNLTEAQKAQARQNIGATAGAVLYEKAQMLSDEQKAVARGNIGAASVTRVDEKVSIQQGLAQAGKAMIVGPDGKVTTGNAVQVDATLSVSGKAADALATGLKKLNAPLRSGQPTYGTSGQLLRTKGNGETEWTDVGLPTDEQTAAAIADWLDEHPEATTTVEDGSITGAKLLPALLEQLSGQVVSVRSYGAVGDDSTDDTEAIQRCIDENPHSTIFFPKGIYRISAGLSCYARVGGTFLFLGGATLKATAAMESMVKFFNYETEYRGSEGGLFGMYGGRLDANHLADKCISNSGIYINVTGTYMMSFNVCGLHDSGSLSSYRQIKCDLVMPNEAWSEGSASGIIADCGDSFFTDVQIQNCAYGVRLRKGGCIFSDCYFFSRTNTTLHPEEEMKGYGIYIEGDAATVPRTTFNNCYFDSTIYAIYSVAAKPWNIALNNCIFFTTLDSYFSAAKVYLLGGSTNVNIRARGIECYSTPTCDMLLGRQNYSIERNHNFLIEQNKPNTNVGNVLNIVNLESAYYTTPTRLSKDEVVMVGAISNANIKNGYYELEVGFGSGYSKFQLRNIGDVFEIMEASRHFTSDYFDIIIDQTPRAGDALDSVTYYPIYLKSKQNSFGGFIRLRMVPLIFKPACCYFYNDGYRTGEFTIDSPFVIQMYASPSPDPGPSPVLERKNICFFGDSITAGVGCTTPFHALLAEMLDDSEYDYHCLNYGVGGSGYYHNTSGTNIVGGGAEGIGTAQTVPSANRVIDVMRTVSDMDCCVILAGYNDYNENIQLDSSGGGVSFDTVMSKTLDTALEMTQKVLVIGPLKHQNNDATNSRNCKLSDYGNLVKIRAQQKNIAYVDGFNISIDPDDADSRAAYMPDGIHPNDAGHQLLAQAVYSALRELLT